MAIEIFENTLLKFIHRQGSDADRKTIILDSGELGYSTDTKRLFIGDGATAGGIVVGNKWKGSSSTITNLSPCEPGDYGYESSTQSLYVLKENNGNNISDWEMVATSVKVGSESPLVVNDGKLDINVEFPLLVEDNTIKLSLSGGGPILDSSDIVNLIYPIGSVFFTSVDINPSSYFTGTSWVQVSQGRFITGVGTGTDQNSNTKTFNSGNNNGEYDHQLTTTELPSHSHSYEAMAKVSALPPTDLGVATGNNNRPATRNRRNESLRLYTSENSGGDQAHNNTPPSFGLYVWRRTS